MGGNLTRREASQPGGVFQGICGAVVAFVVCLASFAMRQVDVGIGAAIVALLAAGAALAWLTMEARRVRQVQREQSSARRGARLRR
jgi:hypothetical protein